MKPNCTGWWFFLKNGKTWAKEVIAQSDGSLAVVFPGTDYPVTHHCFDGGEWIRIGTPADIATLERERDEQRDILLTTEGTRDRLAEDVERLARERDEATKRADKAVRLRSQSLEAFRNRLAWLTEQLPPESAQARISELESRVAELSETARWLQQEVRDDELQIARVRRIHALCKEGLDANDKEHWTDYQRGCAYAFGAIKARLYEALYVTDRELTPEEIAYGLTLQPDAEAALKEDDPHVCPPDPKSGASTTTR